MPLGKELQKWDGVCRGSADGLMPRLAQKANQSRHDAAADAIRGRSLTRGPSAARFLDSAPVKVALVAGARRRSCQEVFCGYKEFNG